MIKVSQIALGRSESFIIEILEPVVYTHVGAIAKGADVLEREKANTNLLVAKVISIAPNFDENAFNIKVGDNILIKKGDYIPITFPVEGYASPKLAIASAYSWEGTILDDIEDFATEDDTPVFTV